MNLRSLSALLIIAGLYPTQISHLDAAPHKKHLKKRTKKAPVKKHYRKAVAVKPKDDTFMCSPTQQSCLMPTPQMVSPTPAVEQKHDPLPVTVKPAETHQPTTEQKTDCDDHIGVYFGLGFGMNHVGGSYSATVTSGAIPDTGIAKYGFGADLHIGYVHRMGDFGLGIEGYFDPTSLKSSKSFSVGGNTQSYDINLHHTYGALLSIGYFVSHKTFLFTRIGLEKQDIALKIVDAGATVLDTSKNQTAMTFGLGVRHTMGNWGFGAEYAYKKYSDISIQGRTKVKPHGNAIRFTISYLI